MSKEKEQAIKEAIEQLESVKAKLSQLLAADTLDDSTPHDPPPVDPPGGGG